MSRKAFELGGECVGLQQRGSQSRIGHASAKDQADGHVVIGAVLDGDSITRSDLSLSATVPGIDEARFREIAADAKANCPVSKLLKAEIGFEVQFNG